MRVHLDTDLGGDPDDVCALAMLLGWPDVELVGITTTIDPGGRRAACVEHCLRLAGHSGIPVVAGAEVSMTTRRVADPYSDERYWPADLKPRQYLPGAALDLLQRSIDSGAIVVGIGPYTNLALLEVARPGTLRDAVLMGGWIGPPAEGLPPWGPEMDWNVQWDTEAARIVAESARLTLVTLAATLKAPLRGADLKQVRATGRLGELICRQSRAQAVDNGMYGLGRAYPGLPDDLLNFHYDPVACAVAVGWPGATIREMRLKPVLERNVLRFEEAPGGRLTKVVVDVDGPAFSKAWLEAITAAQS